MAVIGCLVSFQFSGQTMVVATIKKQSAFQLESSADVYIHNVREVFFENIRFHIYNYTFQPPVNIDDVTTNGLVPTIHVEGDIIRSTSHPKGRQVSL